VGGHQLHEIILSLITNHAPLDLPKTTPKEREPGSPITDVGDGEILVDGPHVYRMSFSYSS
jgi:hypothetical protein